MNMKIVVSLPECVPPSVLSGTITGPADDPRIEFKLADFVAVMQSVKPAAEPVSTKEPEDPVKVHPLAAALKKPTKKAAKKASAAQRRWVAGLDANPVGKPTLAPYVPSEGSAAALVLNAIRNKVEMSSDELRRLICTNSTVSTASVYQACADMKGRGMIELVASEHDGMKRWRLVQA